MEQEQTWNKIKYGTRTKINKNKHETRTNMKQEQTWNKNKCGEKKI